jgi:predicted acylesterase/phospholipase RssA
MAVSNLGSHRFVCATEYETSAVHILSNYNRRGAGFDDIYEELLIWEACRATSAASTFFEPIKVGRSDNNSVIFLDGATGANNPVAYMWEEAKGVFGRDFEERLQVAVSIGTGVPAIRAFGKNLKGVGKTMVELATNTEETNRSFERTHESLVRDDRFFQFNVHNGLKDVGLEDANKQSRIRGVTREYLVSPAVGRRVEVYKRQALPAGN